MNTLHLKYAIEIERTGSISKAAQNLFMAQPNLSKAIHELEETLDITVFERTSRGVVPTEQGREFLDYAKKILEEEEKMGLIRITKGENQLIQTKVSMPRGSYISRAIALFVSETDISNSIKINIKETNAIETIINVSENNFNFGIIRYQKQNEKYFLDYLREKGLNHELLWEFECRILMNKNHKYANKDIIEYDKLMQDSIEIVHGDNIVPYISAAETQNPIDTKCKKAKRIYVYERGIQFDLLKLSDKTHMWVSPMPRELVEACGLTEKECKVPNNLFCDEIIYKNGYVFSETDKKLLDKIFEQKKEISLYH